MEMTAIFITIIITTIVVVVAVIKAPVSINEIQFGAPYTKQVINTEVETPQTDVRRQHE